jgi:hypothetical protein
MRCPWGRLTALAWLICGGSRVAAQQTTEIGAEALATFAEPGLVIGGGYGAIRTSERGRVSALLGAGVSRGELAWRAEAVGHFLLSPESRRRWGVYLAGGLAAIGGPVSRGYLVLGLGIEQRPSGPSGWAGEIGVGGGVRVALAYRWRRFRPSSGQ